MRPRSVPLLSLFALLLLPAVASAQGTPNLSGTWVMDVAQSNFGGFPPLKSRTDQIMHDGTSFKIHRAQTDGQGMAELDFVYGIDGKEWKNTSPNQEITSVLHWEGRQLVLLQKVKLPQVTLDVTDRYELSTDGKMLTLTRHIIVPDQGETDQTFVFHKN